MLAGKAVDPVPNLAQGARTDLCPNLDKSEVHVLDELAAVASHRGGLAVVRWLNRLAPIGANRFPGRAR